MVLFLPLIGISFPANVMLLYKVFIPISALDLVPEGFSKSVFNFSEFELKPYSDRLEILGHDDMNTINNLGSIFYFVLYNVLAYFVSLKFNCKCCKSK